MPFAQLPAAIGSDIDVSQFNEARDAVLERAAMTGISVGPAIPIGTITLASTPTTQINNLRQAIEGIVTSTVVFTFVNPSTDLPYSSLSAFFSAAGIGGGANWTRVPARKGGLTVSSRLVTGDVIYVEHINEIRLAVLELTRVEFKGQGFAGAWIKSPPTVSDPVWTTARALAINSLAGETPTALAAPIIGWNGLGQPAANFFATVDARRGPSIHNAGAGIGPNAPTPLAFANVSVGINAPIGTFTGAPPPSSSGLLEARLGAPSSALVFPVVATWLQGSPWATFNIASGAQVDSPPAGQLPDGVSDPTVSFFLNWGLTDESSDRTGWVAPSLPFTNSFSKQQVAKVGVGAVSGVKITADVVSWTFV